MAGPVPIARTLVTDDGVPIDAVHLPGSDGVAFIVAHGFTLSWQRPAVWRIATRLNKLGGVISFDFRGHGRSGGLSTLGDREIRDLDVAVRYARELGYRRVAGVGFSMGASIVLRYAGLIGGLDAAVSVSGPGRWYFRGTDRMRRVHWAVERRSGRMVTRRFLKTRVSSVRWDPVPVPPDEAVSRMVDTPLLIVHGDKDLFFPVDHAQQLYDAAAEPKDLWIMPGFGHAESGADGALVDRIGRWVMQSLADPGGRARDAAARGRAAPDRASVDGVSLDSAAADGAPPDGVSLDDVALDGVSLDGPALDGVSLDGQALDGQALDGQALDSPALDSADLDAVAPDGVAGGAAAPGHVIGDGDAAPGAVA